MHFLVTNATEVSLHRTHKYAVSGFLQVWGNERYSQKKCSQCCEKQLELCTTHSEYSGFPIQIQQLYTCTTQSRILKKKPCVKQASHEMEDLTQVMNTSKKQGKKVDAQKRKAGTCLAQSVHVSRPAKGL